MPPKGHSSSSHSSRSGSSRSSFGSRSGSSSRSSFSRPSSHSSGSFSSRPSYNSSKSYSSRPSSWPSQHSSGSYGSRPKTPSYGHTPYGSSMPGMQQHRPRVNQPMGFIISELLRPSYTYAIHHDYVYYPQSWTDSSTGTSYQSGYYDENGNRYDSVSYKKDGKYENVLCHCPYCSQDSILTLENDKPSAQDLACPHCGGTMEIRSALDEYMQNSGSSAQTGYTGPVSSGKAKKGNRLLKWIIIVCVVLFSLNVIRACMATHSATSYSSGQNSYSVTQQGNTGTQTGSNSYGSEIHLIRHQDGSYGILSDPLRDYDKALQFDRETGNYYDRESDCWLWLNTDVTPSVWQYWYEGISSDFGDYGWMEWSEKDHAWYIETSAGNWNRLPSRYDTSSLWHIAS